MHCAVAAEALRIQLCYARGQRAGVAAGMMMCAVYVHDCPRQGTSTEADCTDNASLGDMTLRGIALPIQFNVNETLNNAHGHANHLGDALMVQVCGVSSMAMRLASFWRIGCGAAGGGIMKKTQQAAWPCWPLLSPPKCCKPWPRSTSAEN